MHSLSSFLLAFSFPVLFAVSQGIGCQSQVDWLTYRGKQGNGTTSNSLYPPLGQRWKLSLQFGDEELRSFNPPIVKGDSVFFGSSDKNFYALDADSGYMNWIFSAKNKVNSIPYIYQDTVYFGSDDGNLYAVSLKDGEKLWSYQTGRTVQSLVYRYEDYIIFTSDLGSTYFLNPDGEVINSIPNPTWSHHTFQVYDGIVYWAPKSRGFGAYDIRSGRFLWDVKVNVRAPLWYSFPALDSRSVYFSRSVFTGKTADFTYFALDRTTGRSIWQSEDTFQWSPYTEKTYKNVFYRHIYLLDYMAPVLWENLVIYSSGDTTIRAMDRKTGKTIWTRVFDYHTSSSLTAAGDRLYVGLHGSEDETYIGTPPKLLCISAKNGRTLWQMDVEGAVLSAPVISGKRMFFGTSRSRFYIMEEIF